MYKNILVPIDVLESDLINKIIEAMPFQGIPSDAKIHFLTVTPFLAPQDIYGIEKLDNKELNDKKLNFQKFINNKLRDTAKLFNFDENQYMCLVINGTPNYHILNYAEQIDADLIILGSRSRSNSTAQFGSTADYIVNNTNRSVLVIR